MASDDVIESGKLEYTLQAAAQRLGVDSIDDVIAAIDRMIAEREALCDVSVEPTVIGYAVFARKKRNRKEIDPLSYGVLDQPYPNKLLRRGAVQLFKSAAAVKAAIKKTLDDSKQMPWTKDWELVAYPVYESIANKKKNTDDYWICACVKLDKNGDAQAIGMVHRSRKRCSKCGAHKGDQLTASEIRERDAKGIEQ